MEGILFLFIFDLHNFLFCWCFLFREKYWTHTFLQHYYMLLMYTHFDEIWLLKTFEYCFNLTQTYRWNDKQPRIPCAVFMHVGSKNYSENKIGNILITLTYSAGWKRSLNSCSDIRQLLIVALVRRATSSSEWTWFDSIIHKTCGLTSESIRSSRTILHQVRLGSMSVKFHITSSLNIIFVPLSLPLKIFEDKVRNNRNFIGRI